MTEGDRRDFNTALVILVASVGAWMASYGSAWPFTVTVQRWVYPVVFFCFAGERLIRARRLWYLGVHGGTVMCVGLAAAGCVVAVTFLGFIYGFVDQSVGARLLRPTWPTLVLFWTALVWFFTRWQRRTVAEVDDFFETMDS